MFRETTTCSPTSSYDGKFSVSRREGCYEKVKHENGTPKLAQNFWQNSAPSYAAPSCTAPIYAGGTDSLLFYACQWVVYEYATPGENFLLFLLGVAGLYWFLMEPASNLLVFCWLADGSSKMLTGFLLAPAGCLLACRWFQQGAYWYSAGLDRLRAGLLLVPAECLLVLCTGSSRILVPSWGAASNLLVFSRLELVPTMLSVVLFGPELTSPSIHSWS